MTGASEGHMGAPARCVRYDRDGEPCQNLTTHTDGWCRKPGCDGFRRPRVAKQLEDDGPPVVHKTELEAMDALPFTIDRLDRVWVTRRAIDSYLYHHGGDRDGAIKDLLEVVKDFAGEAKIFRIGDAVNLRHEGYSIVLTGDGQALTSYFTAHRERTWPQVKAGVPSRVARSAAGGGPRKPPPEPHNWMVPLVDGPPVALRASDLGVTFTALATFGKLRPDLVDLDPDEVRAELEGLLEACGQVAGLPRADGNYEFAATQLRGIVDPELKVLIRFMSSRDADG